MKTTNIEGNAVDLRPNQITMVVRGGEVKEATDTGFQVMGNRIHEQYAGDMDAFVQDMPNSENFVKLTWVGDSHQFWINATQVKQVRSIDESTKIKYPAAKADVKLVGGANRVVTEDPYDVCKALNDAGAPDLEF